MKPTTLSGLVWFAATMVASAQLPAYRTHSGTSSYDFLGERVASGGDLDNDGFGDLLVGGMLSDGPPSTNSTVAGQVWAFSGASGSQLWTILGSSAHSRLGSGLATFIDFNQDGFQDVLIGAHSAVVPSISGFNLLGRVDVISGQSGASLLTLYGSPTSPGFGTEVRSVGDMTGDGIGDFAVRSGTTVLSLHSGADGSLFRSHANLATVVYPFEEYRFVAAPGDVNADGVPDLAFGTTNLPASLGAVAVHSGATGAVLLTLTAPTTVSTIYQFPTTVLATGDLDADGVADLAAGGLHSPTNSSRRFYAVYSGATGAVIRVSTANLRPLDTGDVNGDGLADLLCARHGATGDNAAAQIHSGATGAVILDLPNPPGGSTFGFSGAMLGDVNGDGLGEFAVGSGEIDQPFYNAGQVYVYTAAGSRTYGVGGAQQTMSLAWYPQGPATPGPGVAGLGGGTPFGYGIGLFGTQAAQLSILGTTVLVNPSPASSVTFDVQFDASGSLTLPASLRIPVLAGLVGRGQIFAFTGVLESSNGIELLFTE